MALYHYQADLGLVPQEVWFVGYILAHRWTAELPYPSLRRMSRRTGVSTQMLHRYKQSLIEKGYLSTIPRHRPSGGRTSNYYDFSGLFQTLEHRLRRDRRDTAWRPTADEAGDPTEPDESLDDDGMTAPTAMPASQRAEDMTWADAIAIASQRGLTGAAKSTLPARSDAEETAPAMPSGQRKKSRSTTRKREPAIAEQERSSPPTASTPRETPKRDLHNLESRWMEARAALVDELSAAAYSAWIEPLEVDTSGVSDARGGDGSAEPSTVLLCRTMFHQQQVERRYRGAIERALGVPVTFVVHPR
jgi:hypothetical protein